MIKSSVQSRNALNKKTNDKNTQKGECKTQNQYCPNFKFKSRINTGLFPDIFQEILN